MSGKWTVQTPKITHVTGSSMIKEWRFETKKNMMEWLDRNKLEATKKPGLKWTYVIINPPASMMKWEKMVVPRRR